MNGQICAAHLPVLIVSLLEAHSCKFMHTS